MMRRIFLTFRLVMYCIEMAEFGYECVNRANRRCSQHNEFPALLFGILLLFLLHLILC
jgi:hypothetical protein